MTYKRPPDAASPHQGHVKTAPCFHPPNEHTGRALPDGAVRLVRSLGKLSKGTLGAPQCGEGADGCPRKSLATVLLYRGEVRRWRTSVRYADHVTTVACRWLLCPFGHLGGPAAFYRRDCKNTSFRGVLRYIVRTRFDRIWSIKIIHLYTLTPKRLQIRGPKWPKV